MNDLAELKSSVLALLKQGRVEEADKLMPPIMLSPPDPKFLAEYARLFAALTRSPARSAGRCVPWTADKPGDASDE